MDGNRVTTSNVVVLNNSTKHFKRHGICFEKAQSGKIQAGDQISDLPLGS